MVLWWSGRGKIGWAMLRTRECSGTGGFQSKVATHDIDRGLHNRVPSALLL
jgi:hypothetical protein